MLIFAVIGKMKFIQRIIGFDSHILVSAHCYPTIYPNPQSTPDPNSNSSPSS